MLTANSQEAGDRKFTLKEEKYNATNFLTLWDFEGVFKYSPLFYGWYTNNESSASGYRLPFAYFVTGLVVYAYSFFATLRKMAENSRMSKLSEKDDECIFTWKLFTAWDYMIGNAETAHNKTASIIMVFKEALLEEAEKKREPRKWKVIFLRIMVNTIVLGLLTFSAYAVVMVVQRSTEKEANSTVWRKNEITIVMSLITLFFPMFFEFLGFLEQYHPRKQLRLQLARIMVLNLLNLYSLIIALFHKISSMTHDQQYFMNISCSESTSIYTTSTPYYKTESYSNSVAPPMSASLLSDLPFNISKATYRKLLEDSAADTVQANSSAYYYDYLDYLENSTVPDSYGNMLENNSFIDDIKNFTNFDLFSDMRSLFEEHLSFILNNFNYDTEDMPLNVSSINMTDILYNGNNSEITTNIFNGIKSMFTSLLLNGTVFINGTNVTNILNTFGDMATPLYTGEENLTFNTFLSEDTEISRYDVPSSTYYDITETTIPTSTMFTQSHYQPTLSVSKIYKGNYTMCAKLRSLCWETMFGQELIKLTVMDLVMTVLYTLAVDFFRAIFVRFMNRFWCWDLEKKFPQYGDFKVAENILHLVNNQGMVWMGMFFSPGLVVLNVIKLHILMYFRTWAVLTCNVPHEVIFRASRSNNFYYALLLMMLFLCVLPVGYAIVIIKPSFHCGPFSNYGKIFEIFTKTIRDAVPISFHSSLDYIASPGIVIPLLVLLVLIIYYLISLTGALREANEDLKIQLRRERTEERRKMFQIVDRRRVGSGELNEMSNSPMANFKKILSTLPNAKSFDDTPKQDSEDLSQSLKDNKTKYKNKDYLLKFFRKALRKASVSEEDQNVEDGTDTEQHDSLPYDSVVSKQPTHKQVKPTLSWNNSDIATTSGKPPRNRGRIESIPSSDSFEAKPALIHEGISRSSTSRRSFDLKPQDRIKKIYIEQNLPSTSKAQEPVSPTWSENIPVIKISKTESNENILEDIEVGNKKSTLSHWSRSKPKIKYALKKQSTEIDEDVVCHFGKELERNLAEKEAIRNIAQEDVSTYDQSTDALYDTSDNKSSTLPFKEDSAMDKSSSDDTEYRDLSINTVLKSPHTYKSKEIE